MQADRKHPPEHPIKLERFLQATDQLTRQSPDDVDVLAITSAELLELINNEIRYYYCKRTLQRRFSLLTRGGALLLASLGSLMPLLAGTGASLFEGLGAYGYPFLVVASLLIVANRMFGATGGHIRYVKAQLALERLVTAYQLNWIALRQAPSHEISPLEHRRAATELMHKLLTDAYHVIELETESWGESVSKAVADLDAHLRTQSNPHAKISPSAPVGEPQATENVAAPGSVSREHQHR